MLPSLIRAPMILLLDTTTEKHSRHYVRRDLISTPFENKLCCTMQVFIFLVLGKLPSIWRPVIK